MPEVAAARAVPVKCGNLVIATIKPTHSESMAMSELSDQAKPVIYRQLRTYHSLLYANRDPYVK